MTEALFYHLENLPLERVLPQLLAKTLEKGWRAVVQAGSKERVEAIDGLLWTFDDTAFLPHGTADDGHDADQPVFVTDGSGTPNGAAVRFLVDRAALPENPAAFERIVLIFDGGDPEALGEARLAWKTLKGQGVDVTYWQQEGGRWRKKA